MVEVLKSVTLEKSIIQLLRSYNCGFDDKIPKVWCGGLTLSIEPPNVNNHQKLNLLPQKCGTIKTYNEMQGDGSTGILKFPWIALIAHRISLVVLV